jgi:uncharacterized protein (DUF305 family)
VTRMERAPYRWHGALIGVVAAVLVAAAGCGNPATVHDAADVAFAQGMLPHHTQAVTMSGFAPRRTTSTQVRRLAEKIAGAQGPEITQMQGFLQTWGTSAPGGGASDGTLTGQQMQELQVATGPAFDRLFLQMMIEQHTDAVDLARAELRDGQNEAARNLAQQIVKAQQQEITDMTLLLNTLPAASLTG